ncbi:MAG: NAD(P)-binding protein, partial [Desulfarculaceae bacterium]
MSTGSGVQAPDQAELPLTSLWQAQKSADIEDYMQAGGYGIAIDTARRGGREVIRILRGAQMRSLDGAGNPVFMGWRSCQTAPAEYKYVICVADDPDPEFPIYRELLLRSPHLVIEGMICGALAVGANEAFLYLRGDDQALAAALEQALQQAHAHGFLGEDALLDLHLLSGDRSFFVWEASHQLAYLEELIQREVTVARGFSQGLFGWPTIIHNPETWAHVPLVLERGANWYCSLGRDLAGTKLLNLKGPVKHPGLVEVPLGTPLMEVIESYAGGLNDGTMLKAVQLGGSSGGYLPEALLGTPLDFEELAEAGVSMGSGEVEVLDDTVCMVARTLELAHGCLEAFMQEEPKAAKLLNRAKRLMGEVEEAQATRSHLGALEKTGIELLNRTAQGSERSVARPLLTALAYFQYDFIHHIEQGVCATGARRGLDTAPCQAACPAGIDIPTYLALIAEGRYQEAIEVIRQDNPLPWVCGIICTHPCEHVCTRGEMDQPISIMALKGFAAEKVITSGGYPRPEMEPPREEKVAVVGSGPGGLSAAFFLAKKGYQVTIFEALPVAGGVLSVGIPEYRLPMAVVQQEIDAILDMGVKLRTGLRVGSFTPMSRMASISCCT